MCVCLYVYAYVYIGLGLKDSIDAGLRGQLKAACFNRPRPPDPTLSTDRPTDRSNSPPTPKHHPHPTTTNNYRSLFALGALLAASIAQSVVVPRLSEGLEDPAVVGAVDALAGLLTAFAAGIGGCLAQLWTEAALALAFGFSALVMVLLFLGGFAFTGTWWLELLLVGGFVAIAWLGHTYASKDKPGASVVATALMGTLLAACAVDGLIEGGKSDGRLLADLTALTTGDWESIGRCGADGRSGCHGWVVALGWIAAAFAGIAVQAKFTGTNVYKLRQLVDAFCFRRDGHQYTEVRDGPGAGGKAKSKVAVRKAHSRGDSHALSEGPRAVNVLPLRVSEGGEEEAEGGMKRTPEEVALIRMLALMYDELTNVFGFQNQSAYNQVEHLVLLLGNQKRYSEAAYKRLVQPAGGVAARLAEAELSPADILHQRLFQNYTKWARHHKVEPQFNTHPGAGDARRAMAGAAPLQAWYETPAAKQKLHDCLLWLLIWGEAANLRHMPECVAWLYHKVRCDGGGWVGLGWVGRVGVVHPIDGRTGWDVGWVACIALIGSTTPDTHTPHDDRWPGTSRGPWARRCRSVGIAIS